MNTTILIIQVVLAIMFTMLGLMKLTQTKEKLALKTPWVNDFSTSTVKLVGTSELLGAIGIIVPYYTNIFPILTPIAAAGLSLIMILAAVYHTGKGEYKNVTVNVILLSLSLVVAFFRFYYDNQ